ncbi:thiamine pyrophosphate-dependent dehydrogenase E1 component subunit alpha [Marinococcus sp. PL1-022]|uniref:thiamine pyrophosphate-dependent dehydrogenase E1 component subunit alpha n=1 Tax=Marinococcus sp. PL1-022 TaxID=3095363 RepID=UPI0029C44A2E|nr:thiamine pyrophosphate-dependent dehydrogenase E1 component subunit alpha [Marinococcus sp. PL1-022]MDX6154074.1 thiamine pyrophosphate-dependent dehydrogenase E1 component subunit alpha [Marinococcus sp. PL1-022]
MWSIRWFDEKVDEFFAKGMIHGTTHLCVGQEASAVGVCAMLEDKDKITSTHRGHGHCIAKGADPDRMMAELFGRETGYCKGKGGSMHIADVEKGNLGANGIVGGGIPLAVGAALTSKMRQEGYITVCFFGDGAANEGSFHEAVNLAAIWDLPVIFVCENNQYGMSGPVKDMVKIENIADRALGYGIPGHVVDGNNLPEVMTVMKEAVEYTRNGSGPVLIEAKTYRWKGHSKSDAKKYRTREEEKEWKDKDPIRFFQDALIERGIITEEEADTVKKATKASIERSVEFAEQSPEPSADTLLEDVYA